MKKIIIGILLFFISVVARAQKQVEHQQQIWFGNTNTIRFNQTWKLQSEVQDRIFINPSAQYQFLLRSHFLRDLGSGWDAGAGFALFLQRPNDPESEINLSVPELRPFLEFNLRQKLKGLGIEHCTGIILAWSPDFNLEAGYMNWFQQQKSGVDYYNRDIFAFNLQHTIESKRTP